jgi:hypothetical protein
MPGQRPDVRPHPTPLHRLDALPFLEVVDLRLDPPASAGDRDDRRAARLRGGAEPRPPGAIAALTITTRTPPPAGRQAARKVGIRFRTTWPAGVRASTVCPPRAGPARGARLRRFFPTSRLSTTPLGPERNFEPAGPGVGWGGSPPPGPAGRTAPSACRRGRRRAVPASRGGRARSARARRPGPPPCGPRRRGRRRRIGSDRRSPRPAPPGGGAASRSHQEAADEIGPPPGEPTRERGGPGRDPGHRRGGQTDGEHPCPPWWDRGGGATPIVLGGRGRSQEQGRLTSVRIGKVRAYPGFLTIGVESGCLLCHRWNCNNHLRHRTKAAR